MYIRAVQAANVYMDNNNLKRYKKVTEGSGKNKVVKYEAMNTYCHITDDELYSAMSAFEENDADEILAFYDLGSAKMNLEMAIEMTDKKVHLYDVALIEGAYTAATLLEAGVDLQEVEKQLEPLKIK